MNTYTPSLTYKRQSLYKTHLNLFTKSLTPQGNFQGYASLFDMVDDGNDTVDQGAFTHSLQMRNRNGGIKMLYQHDPNKPIGEWSMLVEDSIGLFVQGQLDMQNATAQNAYTQMKQGTLDGLSIGYRPLKTYTDAHGIRHLQRLDLWEVSLVTFPMNRLARVKR